MSHQLVLELIDELCQGVLKLIEVDPTVPYLATSLAEIILLKPDSVDFDALCAAFDILAIGTQEDDKRRLIRRHLCDRLAETLKRKYIQPQNLEEALRAWDSWLSHREETARPWIVEIVKAEYAEIQRSLGERLN